MSSERAGVEFASFSLGFCGFGNLWGFVIVIVIVRWGVGWGGMGWGALWF